MPPLGVAVSPPVAQLGRTTSLTISLWQQTGLGAGFPAFVFRPWQAGCGWLWPSELDPCSVSLSDQSDFKKPADDASPAPHRYQPVRSGQRRPWSPAFVGTASRVVLSALIALGYILGWIVSPPWLRLTARTRLCSLCQLCQPSLSPPLPVWWSPNGRFCLFHVGNKIL